LTTTTPPLWPFLLPIIGFVSYSVILKVVRTDVHPLLFLSIAYAVAFVVATLIWLGFGAMGSTALLPRDYVLGALLGLALVSIEFGFLLTLRNGWPIGITTTAINVATATMLLLIGMIMFRERMSLTNMAGAVMCIGGLVLITRR
jgi:drug/metabolite transporter (DMT)-like permease